VTSGFVGLACEEPFECTNEISNAKDKALVFGCNDNTTVAVIDGSNNATEFGTIVLTNTVTMNITGTS
jgi:hypothetical protein